MRKIKENQTIYVDGGLDNSGQLKDGTASDPLSGSTVKAWLANDIYNAIGAIIKASGKSSFDGTPETVDDSELLTALNTIIDTKIQAAVNALQSKIDECAKLNENNTFVGENTFSNTVNFKREVFFLSWSPIILGSEAVSLEDLENKNYATRFYTNNLLANKVTIDKSNSVNEKDFELGYMLEAYFTRLTLPERNQEVFVGLYKNFGYRATNNYNDINSDDKLSGRWKMVSLIRDVDLDEEFESASIIKVIRYA